MSMEAKRREAFEVWFKRDICPSVNYGNPDILRRQLWPAWNAALDSVVIELPELHNMAPDDDRKWHGCRNSTIRTCARAIEIAGLKVKP